MRHVHFEACNQALKGIPKNEKVFLAMAALLK